MCRDESSAGRFTEQGTRRRHGNPDEPFWARAGSMKVNSCTAREIDELGELAEMQRFYATWRAEVSCCFTALLIVYVNNKEVIYNCELNCEFVISGWVEHYLKIKK